MKQFKLTLLLAVLMSMVGARAVAHDFEVVNAEGKTIYYVKTSDTEVAVSYRGNYYHSYSNEYTGAVVIPASVTYSGTTYNVTSIGQSAFYQCSSLTSVEIPNSVTRIGIGAFSGCSSLTSIEIPNSVTSIGNGAFSSCRSLTSVEIPNSVTSIGNSAFFLCSGLTSIEIPNSVTSIGESAFYSCSGLTSVTIGNSVTSIEYGAFYGCSSLTSISIGNSVTIIGESAFSQCSSLTSIEIPNSVTSIGSSAFQDCSGLTSVTIGNSVTSIGSGAFYYCRSLTSIEIPNGVTSIGRQAFSGCRSLTSIEIPNSVTSIEDYTFSGCSGLTSVTIGNGVTSIGREAFSGCSCLTSVEIPNSVTSIGEYTFQNCTSLTSIEIPNSVTSIGYNMFDYCISLTSIYVPFNRLAEWANGSLISYRTELATKLIANAAGSAKYSTYYYGSTVSTKPSLIADENTTVYKAKQKDASTLTLTTIDDRIIPDATAVVLKTTGDEIVLRYSKTGSASDFTDNILQGTNDDMAVGADTYYVLGLSGGNIGFYEFTGTTLAGGKAFIPASSVSGMSARGFTVEEDGETTGIESLTPTLSQGEGAVYDLQGRRVEHPVKGIYIVNGKKVVIR